MSNVPHSILRSTAENELRPTRSLVNEFDPKKRRRREERKTDGSSQLGNDLAERVPLTNGVLGDHKQSRKVPRRCERYKVCLDYINIF